MSITESWVDAAFVFWGSCLVVAGVFGGLQCADADKAAVRHPALLSGALLPDGIKHTKMRCAYVEDVRDEAQQVPICVTEIQVSQYLGYRVFISYEGAQSSTVTGIAVQEMLHFGIPMAQPMDLSKPAKAPTQEKP